MLMAVFPKPAPPVRATPMPGPSSAYCPVTMFVIFVHASCSWVWRTMTRDRWKAKRRWLYSARRSASRLPSWVAVSVRGRAGCVETNCHHPSLVLRA